MKKKTDEKKKQPNKTGASQKKKPFSRGKEKQRAAAPQTPPPGVENIEQWRRDFMLERRQEIREKQRKEREQEQLEIFKRRTRAASGKRSRRTVRTRAYYRFAKNYPSNVDIEGFRENKDGGGKKHGFLLYFLCGLLVFCLAFVVTKTGLMISKETPADETALEDEIPRIAQLRMLRFPYETYAAGNVQNVLESLNEQGCNTAVFEVKQANGYVNLAMPEFAAAGKRDVDPTALLAGLREAGFRSCAYISCFLDPLGAQWELSMAVRKTGAVGDVWTDNAGRGWLNPFSAEARTYLTQITGAAAKAGFDYILLDNVAFSVDSGTAMAYYPGEADGGGPRNGALNDFVADVVRSAAGARVIVMCRYPAFDPLADSELPGYGGNLLQTAAGILCVDARLSFQQKNVTVGTEHFSDVSQLPLVFTLSAGDYALQGIADSLSGAEGMICIENDENIEDTLRAVRLMNVYGYLIW